MRCSPRSTLKPIRAAMASLEIKPNSGRSARNRLDGMLARGPIAACEECLGPNYVAAQLLFRRSPVTSIDYPGRPSRQLSSYWRVLSSMSARQSSAPLTSTLNTEESLSPKRRITSSQASSASCGRFSATRTAPLLPRAVATRSRMRRGLALPRTGRTTSSQASSASCGRFSATEDGPSVHEGDSQPAQGAPGSRSSRTDGPPRRRLPARPAAALDR